MGKRKISVYKLIMTILFAVITFTAFFWVIFKGELEAGNYLSYGCVGACFLLALVCVGSNPKKIFTVIALGVTVAADYFLIFAPSEQNSFVGLCVFCGVQLVYAVYTMYLNKSIGARVMNLAVRTALCLIACFVLPNYFVMGLTEYFAICYILNSIVTLGVILIHIKKNWLLFIGFFLFFACDIFVGLTNGGAVLLGITGPFLEFITKYNIVFYTYIPGLFLIATSSVWAKPEREES